MLCCIIGKRPLWVSQYWLHCEARSGAYCSRTECGRAEARAACTAGNNSAINTPIMAITTNSSTNVNADLPSIVCPYTDFLRSQTIGRHPNDHLQILKRFDRFGRPGAWRQRFLVGPLFAFAPTAGRSLFAHYRKFRALGARRRFSGKQRIRATTTSAARFDLPHLAGIKAENG